MNKNEWKRFHNLGDEDIDVSDIPELDESFWKNAKVTMPPSKKAISLRLDEDLLDWFKCQGKGYQSLINAVLRSYYQTHDNNKH